MAKLGSSSNNLGFSNPGRGGADGSDDTMKGVIMGVFNKL